jgi:SAM-dependent methyltransferase
VREFTGERVIPGQVNNDLWAEHVARYAFASGFAEHKRTLDAGAGTGYGAQILARHASNVTGIDVAFEAVDFARNHAHAANIFYLQASATGLPFSAGAFDLITAFEVIEHLPDWQKLLTEVRRTLAPAGLFLVSTPNRLYYAESRRLEGPNPFHVHEFEFEEFRGALRDIFPNVAILYQNRIEAFAFHGRSSPQTPAVQVDAIDDDPENAHFFLAVCSQAPLPTFQPFIYVPRAANVLREREHHIHLLDQELAQSKRWLDQNILEHHALQQAHEEQTLHLAEQNRWAMELEQQLTAAQARIVELQEEASAIATGYKEKVAALEEENRQKTAWAIDVETRLTADLAARAQQLAQTVNLLDAAEQTVVERTEWARRLDADLNQLQAQFAMLRQSRWIKLGRTVGLGPRLD